MPSLAEPAVVAPATEAAKAEEVPSTAATVAPADKEATGSEEVPSTRGYSPVMGPSVVAAPITLPGLAKDQTDKKATEATPVTLPAPLPTPAPLPLPAVKKEKTVEVTKTATAVTLPAPVAKDNSAGSVESVEVTDSASSASCMKQGMVLQNGALLPAPTEWTATPESCQQKCHSSTACSFFTWKSDTHPMKGGCWLFPESSLPMTRVKDPNATSGVKDCLSQTAGAALEGGPATKSLVAESPSGLSSNMLWAILGGVAATAAVGGVAAYAATGKTKRAKRGRFGLAGLMILPAQLLKLG